MVFENIYKIPLEMPKSIRDSDIEVEVMYLGWNSVD
jgi:hypothetical protein